MAEKKNPSDAQIISRLKRRPGGLTASELHTTSQRLRGIEGVVEVGRQQTGKAGRPAIIFALAQNVEPKASDTSEPDPTQASREGSLS